MSIFTSFKLSDLVFILDVDGVMTDGSFYYSIGGKIFKKFGPEDADALNLIRNKIEIRFVSADHRGFAITKKRIVDDMEFRLDLVTSDNRLNWIASKYDLSKVIYMGDSFKDIPIVNAVALGIVPSSASQYLKKYAKYITKCGGGQGAVAEACFYIADNFGIKLFELI